MVQFHMVAWSALMHGWCSDKQCHTGLLHQAPWLCQKPNCGSTVHYSAPSYCRCGIQRHRVDTVDENGFTATTTILGLAVAALQLVLMSSLRPFSFELGHPV